jgi:protein-tyrosine phosphatase
MAGSPTPSSDPDQQPHHRPDGHAPPEPVAICFVCLGNICRSPTAAGVMRHLVDEAGVADRVIVESAGTGSWHVGELPDERAREEAARRNIDIDDRARHFEADDIGRYDLIVGMDQDNLDSLHRLADRAGDGHDRIVLLRSFDPDAPPDGEVPDPYFGGDDGFSNVFDMIEAACRGLLEHLAEHHGWPGERHGRDDVDQERDPAG